MRDLLTRINLKCITKTKPINARLFKNGLDDNYIFDNVITHSLQPRNGKGQGGKGHLFKTDGKSYSLDTAAGQTAQMYNSIRRLTPIECERLQTVPDNYTAGVSDSQRYKMLGNGWTVDVIAHIFSYLKINQ